jgi:hypothetical protein
LTVFLNRAVFIVSLKFKWRSFTTTTTTSSYALPCTRSFIFPTAQASKCVDADYFSAENDTLACLQQLLESNVKKLSVARWERVATTFVKLFRTTTPHQLFDENLRVEIDSGTPEPQETNGGSPLIVLRYTFLTLQTDGDGQAIIPAPLSPTQNDSQRRLLRRH